MKSINKLQVYIIPLIIFSFILMTGCATIFKGAHADVRVNSDPAGASIFINKIDKGTTPQTLSLKRNRNYTLVFKKEGYEPVRMEVTKDFDIATTIVGNIFSWALLGIVVDVATGAAYSLEPADIEANFSKLKEAGYLPKKEKMEKSDIYVMMLSKKEWSKISAK